MIIILALKNRTEHVSNQADFFPVFCTLIIFNFTFLTMAVPIFIKLLFAFLIFMVVILLLQSRLKIRLHLAHTKELINILEQYKNEHT
ncbi:hypothetical protein HA050_11320 [Iodobacter sp. HSC-16F04]|uniref:Uncharacterized protein n=1 Tax=Iodobacter violaceini TaxID=3044271 RepID=A0ABX0KW57_9NEIS|nr:hypothetical protein [Iodobacter violacea]NHQ86707.1 hypothetical protein [Iodobacter violacea]